MNLYDDIQIKVEEKAGKRRKRRTRRLGENRVTDSTKKQRGGAGPFRLHRYLRSQLVDGEPEILVRLLHLIKQVMDE